MSVRHALKIVQTCQKIIHVTLKVMRVTSKVIHMTLKVMHMTLKVMHVTLKVMNVTALLNISCQIWLQASQAGQCQPKAIFQSSPGRKVHTPKTRRYKSRNCEAILATKNVSPEQAENFTASYQVRTSFWLKGTESTQRVMVIQVNYGIMSYLKSYAQ